MPSKLDASMGAEVPNFMPEDAGDIVQGNSQPIWSDEVDLDADSLGIPFLSLMQGLSKAVTAENSTVKMGDYMITGYDPVKEVQLVPLKFGVSRSFSTQDEEGALVQHCYAPTAPEKMTHGIALDSDGPGILCESCALKDWTPTDKVVNGRKQNAKPQCVASYDFLCFSITHETLCRIGFKSASAAVGRQLAMLAKTKGLGKIMVEVGSERTNNGKFTYAKATMRILTPDPDILAAAHMMVALPESTG